MKHNRQACWMISSAWLATAALSVTTVSVLASFGCFNPCLAASNMAREFHYRAQHPVFGDIGTYSNTIESAGDTTTIRTTVHLKVTALGVVLHREDAERTEDGKGIG